jgi:hypothetical protein
MNLVVPESGFFTIVRRDRSTRSLLTITTLQNYHLLNYHPSSIILGRTKTTRISALPGIEIPLLLLTRMVEVLYACTTLGND